MTRTKAFTAQRWSYTARDGHPFLIVKGSGRYSKFYVCSTDGVYLSPKGNNTLLDAQIEAEKIAKGN